MTVLVADDESVVLNVVRIFLQREGYRVVCARSRGEAEVYYAREAPDLMILDVGMPGAADLVDSLRQRYGRVKVLYQSGYPLQSLPHVHLDVGDSFIQKPFMSAALVAIVGDVLGTTRDTTEHEVGAGSKP